MSLVTVNCIDIVSICSRMPEERLKIALTFKTMYGKDMINELRSELRGDLEDVIVALVTAPAQYDAQELNYAMTVVYSPLFLRILRLSCAGYRH